MTGSRPGPRLQDGEVPIRVSDSNGQELIIGTLGRGKPIRELCFFAGRDHRWRTLCGATVAGGILEVTSEDFLESPMRPEVLTALTYIFCIRLNEAEQRLDVLMRRGSERRLAACSCRSRQLREPPIPNALRRVSISLTTSSPT